MGAGKSEPGREEGQPQSMCWPLAAGVAASGRSPLGPAKEPESEPHCCPGGKRRALNPWLQTRWPTCTGRELLAHQALRA